MTMMKTLLLVAALAVAGSGQGAGDAHGHVNDQQPRHGGVVVEVRHLHYELVAQPAAIQLHVRDHGKPMDISKASARLTLLTGADKQEVELKPAGDKLEAKGAFKIGPNSKAVVVVSIDGKVAGTARFALK